MNWRDAFPVQEVGKYEGLVFVLYTRYTSEGVAISIEKQKVECTLTEEELVSQLNEVVKTFTHKALGKHKFDKTRADNDVARRCRRGKANAEWNGSRYYKGVKPVIVEGMDPPVAWKYDGPLVVGEHNGKFAISLNPKFDDYGYVI